MTTKNHAMSNGIVATQENIWNHETVIALRKNVSRFIRTDDNGDNVYVSIRLATPTSDSGYGDTYKSRQESRMVLTESGYVSVADLGVASGIQFELTIESTGTSEFTNGILKFSNGTIREKRTTTMVTAFGSMVTNELKIENITGFVNHLAYNPPMLDATGNVAYMLKTHLERAKADKSAQQWAKRNGVFVDKR